MNEYKLDLHFDSVKECNEWENENIVDGKYNGEFVLMVNHSSTIGEDGVTLVSIFTV